MLRVRNKPEDNSKQESESRDQIAHSWCKSGRAVIYPSEYKVLHHSDPPNKKPLISSIKTQNPLFVQSIEANEAVWGNDFF